MHDARQKGQTFEAFVGTGQPPRQKSRAQQDPRPMRLDTASADADVDRVFDGQAMVDAIRTQWTTRLAKEHVHGDVAERFLARLTSELEAAEAFAGARRRRRAAHAELVRHWQELPA